MKLIIGIVGFLFILLFVIHISHPSTRRFLFEGFEDYSKPSIDLTTEPDVMAFYKFHTDVCVLWNTIITEVMKNDCVDPANACPSKPVYIKNLLDKYNKDGNQDCFVRCETPWTPASSLEELEAGIPQNIKCYKGTLKYIRDKSSEILQTAQTALEAIPPVSAFADYQTTIDCKGTTCTDSKGAVYEQKESQKQKPPEQLSQSDEQKKQVERTKQIVGRCKIMNTEIPELKSLMGQAISNVEKLAILKKKAQDGTLLPPVPA